jgi:type VI secretion system secreted protein VgrG
MSLPVSVSLAGASFDRAHVRRLDFVHRLGEPWAARVEVAATDVDVDLEAVVGSAARIDLEGEPFLPSIAGIVRDARQTVAESTGESTYVFDVAPACSFLQLRRTQRIFQHRSVPQILGELLGEHKVPTALERLHEDHPEHEYIVQWKETDLSFCQRLLAEEGISLVLDPREDAALLVDDSTTATELLPVTLPILPDAQALRSPDEPPCVRRVGVGRGLEAARFRVRDYDFEHPDFMPEAEATAGPHGRELGLDVCEAQVGDFHDEPGAALAGARRLQALRSRSRTIELLTNVVSRAGVRVAIEGSSRAAVDGELLVIEAETSWTSAERRTRLECIPAGTRFRPPRRPKPRVHGTQTAFVVTPAGKEIDVDEHGRVEVEFRWDRRDLHRAGTSRRVRVSQPWAGPGFGMTLIPRRNEEVVIAYLDGDPDQPMVVGRVHNGWSHDPLDLPAQQTQSIWKSRSVPGGPEAYNMIRMEDAAGAEMLELRAQRDFRSETLRNSETIVGVDETKKVGGSSKTEIAGAHSLTAASSSTGTGAYSVSATSITLDSKGHIKETSGGQHFIDTSSFWVSASGVAQISAKKIVLMAGGSSITLTPGGIEITSSGPVDVHGLPIKLNCS